MLASLTCLQAALPLAEAAEQRKIYFFHNDHLGSTTMVTNEQGQVVSRAEYAPYGATVVQTGAAQPAHRFTGQRLDTSTSLYFFNARYYDPQLGRFIQPDSIVQAPADPQTLNRYSYARNNPLKFVDPSGHFWFIPFIIAAVKATAVFAAAHPFIFGAAMGALTGGINAAAQGTNIAKGIGVGAAMGLITGGINSMIPGGGTFSSNLLANMTYHSIRGAAIGAVMGGTINTLAGGTFSEGAKQGAIGGGIMGAVGGFASSEQFGNWVQSDKFMSNSRFLAHQSLKTGFFEQLDGLTGSVGRFGLHAGGPSARHGAISFQPNDGSLVAIGKRPPGGAMRNSPFIFGRSAPGVMVDDTAFIGAPGVHASFTDLSPVQANLLQDYVSQSVGVFNNRYNCMDWALGASRYIGNLATPTQNVRSWTYTDPALVVNQLDN